MMLKVPSNVSKSYRKMYTWSESGKHSYYDASAARLQINCDSCNCLDVVVMCLVRFNHRVYSYQQDSRGGSRILERGGGSV